MPLVSRIRDASNGGLRASVEGRHEHGSVAIDVEAGRAGVRSGEARVRVARDGYEGNARVSAQGGRVQASGALRASAGSNSAGAQASVTPDRMTLGGDVQLGPARASIAADSAGRPTATLDVGGALADGLDVRLHVGRAGEQVTARAGGTLRLSRFLPLPDARCNLSTIRTDPQPVPSDPTLLGQLRARTLEEHPNSKFERHQSVRTLQAAADRSLPLGPAGVQLGFERGKEVTILETRLNEGGLQIPIEADADSLAAMRPGEGLELSGQARLSLRSQVSAQLSPVPVRVGVTGAFTGTALRSGRVSIAIDKEEGSWARVTLRGQETLDTSATHALDIGPRPALPQLKLQNFLGDLALDYAHAHATEKLRTLLPLGVSARASFQRTDNTLLALRVTMDDPRVREGLDQALLGDWSALLALAGTAVVEETHRARGVQETARDGRTRSAFGRSRTFESVITSSERLETRPEGLEHVTDRSWMETESWRGWFNQGRSTSSYLENEVARAESQPSQALTQLNGVLEWTLERKLRDTHRNLEEAFGLATLLDDQPALTSLRTAQAASAGGRTKAAPTMRLSLTIDDDGLNRAAALPMSTLWAHAIAAWQATHTRGPSPLWVRPGGQTSLEEWGPLRHEYGDYAPYYGVREFLEELTQTAQLPKPEGMRRLHHLLEARKDDHFWLAILAQAVGPSSAKLTLSIADGGMNAP